jgi:hypothetical protein
MISSCNFVFTSIVIAPYILMTQVWTQKCAVQKASVDVNTSYKKKYVKDNIIKASILDINV